MSIFYLTDMERLQRNKAFLQQLRRKNERVKKLKNANMDNIKLFADCAKNLVEGNISIPKSKMRKLKVMKEGIRLLARKSVPLKKKKRILVQRGGAIASLLIPIISTIAGLIAGR